MMIDRICKGEFDMADNKEQEFLERLSQLLGGAELAPDMKLDIFQLILLKIFGWMILQKPCLSVPTISLIHLRKQPVILSWNT